MSSIAMSGAGAHARPSRPAVSWPEPDAKEAVAEDLEDRSPAKGWSTLKLLTVLSVLSGIAVICAFAIIGLLSLRATDQRVRIDNLGSRINQQQVVIDHLQNQVNDLQRRK